MASAPDKTRKCSEREGRDVLRVDFLELPHALLQKILILSGSKGICRAGSTCRTFYRMQKELAKMPVFASGMEMRSGSPTEAVAKLTETLLDGMMGAVDFALVFFTRYKPCKLSGAKLRLALVDAAKQHLPENCCVIGCAGLGVGGLLNGVQPHEVDPLDDEVLKPAVTILLGRVPGHQVHVHGIAKVPKPNNVTAEGLPSYLGIDPGDRPQLIVVIGQLYLKKWGLNTENLAKAFPEAVAVGGICTEQFAYDPTMGELNNSLPRLVALTVSKGSTVQEEGSTEVQTLCTTGEVADSSVAKVLAVKGLGPVDGINVWKGMQLGSLADLEGDGGTWILFQGGHGPNGEAIENVVAAYSSALTSVPSACQVSLALWMDVDENADGNDPSDRDSRSDRLPDLLLQDLDEIEAEVPLLAGYVEDPSAAKTILEKCKGKTCTGELMMTTKEVSAKIVHKEVGNILGSEKYSHQALYEHLAEAAKGNGILSGPRAIFNFMCCGRGMAFYGEPHKEAAILHKVTEGRVPYIGIFTEGELGPSLSHGMSSVHASGPGRDVPTTRPGSSAADLLRNVSHLQGYTSMFTLLDVGFNN